LQKRSTTNSIANAALPHKIVRVTQLSPGLEFYFPPLRNLGAAAGFGAFGALSIALPVAAAASLGLTDGPGAQGWLVIILVGGFALPILAFGVVFIALAAYLLANSLTVVARPDHIATVRRLFGLTLSRRTLSCTDIPAVEPLIPARFQNQFSAEPHYQLIARSRNPAQAGLVIAESLPGRAVMERMAALIAGATGIGLAEN
jgi:hypothetical protein